MVDAPTGTGQNAPAPPHAHEVSVPDPNARRMRRVRWVAIVTFSAFLLAAWGRLLIVDGPLPDDSDLIHEAVEVAPEDNGWEPFDECAAEIQRIDVDSWFENHAQSPLVDIEPHRLVLERASEWPGSPEARSAHEFLDTQGFAYASIDEILGRPRMVVPLVPGAATDPADGWTISALGRCLDFRSRVAAIEGRTDDAIADCLRRLELGARYRLAENGVISHRGIGALEERWALIALFDHLRGGSLHEEQLSRIAKAVEEPPGAEAALDAALRRHYSYLRDEILATPRTIAFKPHRTLAALSERRRAQVRALRLPYARRGASFVEEQIEAWERVISVLSGNGDGFLLAVYGSQSGYPDLLANLPPLNEIPSDLQWCLEHHDAALFVRRAASVAVASMRHRLRTGELPASLDVLVPELLPALPADPFTHGPIRYDPVQGLLWSPGSDGVDYFIVTNGSGLVSSQPEMPYVRIPPP